jgi:hypothetical protein
MSSTRSKRRNILQMVDNMIQVTLPLQSVVQFEEAGCSSNSILDSPMDVPVENEFFLQMRTLDEVTENFDEIDHYDCNASEFSYSSSESDLSDINDHVDFSMLRDDLKDYLSSTDVPFTFIKGLLNVLRKYHPCLPSDPRTLMNTNRSALPLKLVEPGYYYHFGIRKGLEHIIPNLTLTTQNLFLELNIDGMPLFKSTVSGFWPILASLHGFSNTVFVVGLYYGVKKPLESNDFLCDLIQELKVMLVEGLYVNNVQLNIQFRCCCCDTPARAFVKCIKGHSGYFGCDRCIIKGDRCDNRLVFVSTDNELREDSSFRLRVQSEHHHGASPFEQLPMIDMVTMFPNDYMHSICKGNVLYLLEILRTGPLPYRLSPRLLEKLSEKLWILRPRIASDFQRRPRSFKHLSLWKATELRLFCLYLAPIVLPGIVNDSYFKNFMCLSVLMRILCHPQLCRNWNDYASELAETFLSQMKALYGERSLTYNAHSIIHLVADCQYYGSADSFSCFQYESFLYFLKKTVHSPNRPLEQAVNRILEKGPTLGFFQVGGNFPVLVNQFTVVKPTCLETVTSEITYYKKIIFKETVLRGSSADGYILTKDTQVVAIKYIAMASGNIFIVGRSYMQLDEAFIYPCSSKRLDIFRVQNRSRILMCIPMKNVLCKLQYLELDSKCICIPILHTYSMWD